MSYVVAGDSDLYGLGVRLGLYLTGAACILARIFAPSRAGVLTSGLHVLTFAITLTLIKNVIQGRPARLELYLVLATTQLMKLMLQISGAAFSGVASAVSTALVSCHGGSVCGYSVGVLGTPVVGVERRRLRTNRWVFGVVDVTGRFGTFLAILPIVMLGFALLMLAMTVWPLLVGKQNIFRAISEARKEMGLRQHLARSDSMEAWFAQVNQLLSAQEGDSKYTPIPKVHVSFVRADIGELPGLLTALAMSIWFTEDTLRLSNVQVDGHLQNIGQLLPLVVGFVSVMSVFAG
jgi:hypothetical protein